MTVLNVGNVFPVKQNETASEISKEVCFWSDANAPKIYPEGLCEFLESEGFSNFQASKNRTSKKILVRNNNGIVEIHDFDSVWRFVRDYLTNDHQFADSDEESRVRDFWFKQTTHTVTPVLRKLKVTSEDKFPSTERLPILRDSINDCYIPFENGVVRIDKRNVTLLDWTETSELGCVWESSRLPHNVQVNSSIEESPFHKFVRNAFRVGITPQLDRDLKDEGLEEKRLAAFRTSIGYLIHSYNPPSQSKLVVFVDTGNEMNQSNGGNGKSLLMQSVQHLRKTVTIQGSTFQNFSKGQSSRFNFSGVGPDTRFVCINDTNPDFDMRSIFAMITDDMEVERKGVDKFVISQDKKPKLGITTNFVPSGSGNSYERRLHIVEFGDFWKRANDVGITPPDLLGKELFTDQFTDDDWNAFFNFCFSCIRDYLSTGLIKYESKSYQLRRLISEVEGPHGDGSVTEWMKEWVESSPDNHPEGISFSAVISEIYRDIGIEIVDWDQKRLKQALFTCAMMLPGYEPNRHFADKGDSLSDRRWRKGPKGQQQDFIKISKV